MAKSETPRHLRGRAIMWILMFWLTINEPHYMTFNDEQSCLNYGAMLESNQRTQSEWKDLHFVCKKKDK